MKIAYAGIDLFYPALETIISQGCEIIKIYTCETDNETEFNLQVIDAARRQGIDWTTQRMTPADISWLKAQGCEAFICAGYYYRIPVDPVLPMVNIHPSLLPVGRGSWPMPVTILKGLNISGVTIHKMAEAFDTGDILLQQDFAVSEDETLETFMAKVHGLLPGMVRQLLGDFDRLYANARPQGNGEYWPAPQTRDWTITEAMTPAQADRILRAFYGYDCIYEAGGRTWRLLRGRLIMPGAADAAGTPGNGCLPGVDGAPAQPRDNGRRRESGTCDLPFRDGFIRAEYVEEL